MLGYCFLLRKIHTFSFSNVIIFFFFHLDSLYQSSVKHLEDSRKRWALEMEDSCNVS